MIRLTNKTLRQIGQVIHDAEGEFQNIQEFHRLDMERKAIEYTTNTRLIKKKRDVLKKV